MNRKKIEKLEQNNQKLCEYSKRLNEIRSKLCDNNNQKFANLLGVSTGYASNLCNKKEAITDRTLQKILKIFPEVSSTWLYLGEGEMLKTDSSRQRSSVAGDNRGIIVQHGDNSTYNNNSELASVVLAQQETINKQQATITALTETNRQQTEQIGKLIEMLSK